TSGCPMGAGEAALVPRMRVRSGASHAAHALRADAARAAERSWSNGMELGRYRKVAVLGKGGMGIVHLAVARGEGGFEKAVALKELRPELSGDPDHVRMLLEEAKLGARLVHPNLVEVLDVGRDGERWFVALRLL